MTTDTIDSPVRSASGKIRNLGAMGEPKFSALLDEMGPYRESDAEGFTAVEAEATKRGIDWLPDATVIEPEKPALKKIKPQLLETRDDVADAHRGKPASIEPKWDGWRLLADIHADGVHLYNRADSSLTANLPELAAMLEQRLPAGTVLDGEAATRDDSWGSAQSVLGSNPENTTSAQRATIRYVVFDVVRFGGNDMSGMTYSQRRTFMATMFEELLDDQDHLILLTPSYEATQENYKQMIAAGAEGGVVKLHSSHYAAGQRGHGWFRVKPAPTLDVVAMEFVAGTGERGTARGLGAIKFGQYRDGVLTYRAACGTGFTDEQAREVWDNQEKFLGQPFEIGYFGSVGDGTAPRTPSFHHWRTEKAAEDCTWEKLQR